ncbi:polysaccharide deacetylase family protein [Streptosporangium sp. NPDC051023]|uniref:polysaccharide deacetylase family protein n=1 Tax=Streptosporangium sp. NPDC051023 TaxID=3155410 RepID=UPI00344D4865
MINYVDPSGVHGLNVRTVAAGDSADPHMYAAYPSIDDAPRLNEKLLKTVKEQLDRFGRDASRDADLPHREFNIDWQLAAASDQVIGVRLRIGESVGAGWSESRTTVWYDRTDSRVLDSAALLKDRPALEELASIVRDRLAGPRRETSSRTVKADPGLFDSLGFNPRGDLVVEFDDNQVGAASLGRVAVAVPASEAEPLLSATGARAQRAALKTTSEPGSKLWKEFIAEAGTAKPPAASSQTGSVDCAKAKCVALTYDDGPGPDTGRLLDLLGADHARATFFSLGANASARPEPLKRMMREGHLVANHTWSHRDLTALTDNRITDQLNRAQYAITQTIGQVPALLRPPYGATDDRIASIAAGRGLAVVRWSADSRDLRTADPKVIAKRVVAEAKPGAIILMHDVYRPTVDATPEILRRLREKGYTFVTVPELYGSLGMLPGGTYNSGDSTGWNDLGGPKSSGDTQAPLQRPTTP